MMPFYGKTPNEAAGQLSRWLALAHGVKQSLNSLYPSHNPDGRRDCAILTSVSDLPRRHSFATLAVPQYVADARRRRCLSMAGKRYSRRRTAAKAPLPRRRSRPGARSQTATGGRLTAEELVASMRAVGRYARAESDSSRIGELRADAQTVGGARPPHERALRGRSRPRGDRRHQRDRPRRARLLSDLHGPVGQAGRRRRLDAQPEHAWL